MRREVLENEDPQETTFVTQPLQFLMLMGVALTLVGSTLQAADRTEELLLRVPAAANVVAVVDVEGMFKSPLGTSQKWNQRYRTDYANGLVPFPPSVQLALLAAELNPETIHTNWELGIVRLNQPFIMKDLAARELTPLEKFEGRSLVTTIQRTYFVELMAQTIAVTNHQNRQDMARWLRFTKTNAQPVVSDYLRNAVLDRSTSSQYRLALDLQDIPHLDEVRFKLDHMKTDLTPDIDRDALAKIITGIRGLRVDVQIGDSIQATVRLDFSDRLEPVAKVLPALALEVFVRRGIDLPELHRAKVRVEEQSIVFENTLSEPSLRRLLSRRCRKTSRHARRRLSVNRHRCCALICCSWTPGGGQRTSARESFRAWCTPEDRRCAHGAADQDARWFGRARSCGGARSEVNASRPAIVAYSCSVVPWHLTERRIRRPTFNDRE